MIIMISEHLLYNFHKYKKKSILKLGLIMKLGSFKSDALQKVFLKTKHIQKKQMFGKNHQH